MSTITNTANATFTIPARCTKKSVNNALRAAGSPLRIDEVPDGGAYACLKAGIRGGWGFAVFRNDGDGWYRVADDFPTVRDAARAIACGFDEEYYEEYYK